MPLVRIEMLEGKSPAYKKNVLNAVHEGLLEAFQIADDDRFQRIAEYKKENFETPEGKTDAFMIVELTVFPGRTKEQKQRAIESITQKLCRRLAIQPTDVFIVFHEPPLENWGMAGRQKG